MNEKSAKVLRLSLEWGIGIACIVAIVQGGATLTHFIVIALVIAAGTACTVATWEHGWFSAPFWLGTPLRFGLIEGIIWGALAFLGWYVSPSRAYLFFIAAPDLIECKDRALFPQIESGARI